LTPLFGDLRDTGNVYVLRETATRVADCSILLIGGWEDSNVTVEQTVLPYYRALKKAGAQDVTFLVYHTDHTFLSVSQRLASDIRDWLNR
jgi:dipeptidyl aminopeptidase/acylaminoacyl peptidase